jgi:uncharacterized membrane protein (DUF4010 family)
MTTQTTKPSNRQGLPISPWALLAALGLFVILLPEQWKPLPWGMPLQKALTVALIILIVQQCGILAMRWLGARHGLALMGLAGGFASSTATVIAMGSMAHQYPSLSRSLAVGALLSCLSTILQIALILYVMRPELAWQMKWHLIAGSLIFLVGACLNHRKNHVALDAKRIQSLWVKNKPIHALYYTALIYSVSVFSEWTWQYGDMATAGAIVLSALADVHAAVLAAINLNATHLGTSTPEIMTILMAITVNAALKSWVAYVSAGEGSFSSQLIGFCIFSCGCMWLVSFINQLLTS